MDDKFDVWKSLIKIRIQKKYLLGWGSNPRKWILWSRAYMSKKPVILNLFKQIIGFLSFFFVKTGFVLSHKYFRSLCSNFGQRDGGFQTFGPPKISPVFTRWLRWLDVQYSHILRCLLLEVYYAWFQLCHIFLNPCKLLLTRRKLRPKLEIMFN